MINTRSKANLFDIICISPHLDDAILSAGNLLAYAKNAHQKIAVITVFTQAQNNYISKDGLNFIAASGHRNATSLFDARRIEDRLACKTLGITNFHLPYIDGQFRQNNGQLLYPSFQSLFSGKIHHNDALLISSLKKKITSLLEKLGHTQTVVLSPLGVGNHADHLIVTAVCKSLKGKRVIFWEDIPYRNDPIALIRRLRELAGKRKTSFVQNYPTSQYAAQKANAINCYRTQVQGLQRTGLDDVDYVYERFYRIFK